MRKTMKLSMSLAALALATSLAAPAGAHEEGGTHVESLAASRSGDFLFVNGSATFVDAPGTVMEDAGDGTLVDVTTGTISRPDPSSTTLDFSLDIEAATTDWPQMVYMWPIMVDGVDDQLFLMGSRFGLVSNTPQFILARSGDGGFTTVANLQGSLTADRITWKVPMFRIGAEAGDTISQGSGSNPEVRTGMAGSFYCCTTADQYDNWFLEDYTVPGAKVQLGIAEAGTPESLVPLTTSGTVSGGDFTGALNVSGLAAGDYVVVAKACYSEGDCSLSSTTITI